MHGVLRRAFGFPGSYQAVRRYLTRTYPAAPVQAVRRVETPPGVQAQHDWFDVTVRVARVAMPIHGLLGSMSRADNPYDNAQAESFMKTLKHEEIYLRPYRTMDDVLRHLPIYLEHTYNEQRLHSALGYLSPAAFEALHQQPLTGQNQAVKLST